MLALRIDNIAGELNLNLTEVEPGVPYSECGTEGLESILKKLIISTGDGYAIQINTI